MHGEKIIALAFKLADVIGLLLAPCAALVAAVQARIGSHKLPMTFRIWDLFKVMPIRYHYYQPVYNVAGLPASTWSEKDPLYGVDLNVEGQLKLLQDIHYNSELERVPIGRPDRPLGFFHNNPTFGPGDAEILYSMIRHFRPKRVIEVGSGFSTRMAKHALDRNREEGSASKHVCIEPYEMPWLESLGVDQVIRSKVEDLDLTLFRELKENDILFIDSSHVLRTRGDVYHIYLHILPNLSKGVLVHVHDVFLPSEYPKEWILSERRFWNEQYLLQAFLAFNSEFEVVLAIHYLSTHHPEELSAKCPVYSKFRFGHGSFWMRRKFKENGQYFPGVPGTGTDLSDVT